jgi:hypothetical protein
MKSCWNNNSSFWLSTCGDKEPFPELLEMLLDDYNRCIYTSEKVPIKSSGLTKRRRKKIKNK